MAATASMPPSLSGTMPTSLKDPATLSTKPKSVTFAADRPTTPARNNSSKSAQRRSARQPSLDFLSDRTTTALIRRTLCAKNLADRERSTPSPIEELLPPLTSRNDVDLQLYALISIILREFVQTWYTRITPDETFVAEIVQIFAHCTRALEQRLRSVDLESLLLDELPELFDAHVRAYRIAKDSMARPPIEANFREIYHSLCPLPALSPVPRTQDLKSIQAQADNEIAYRQLLVQGVLALLLPTEDLENECLTSLVGQMFSELIIGNLVANKVSDPWLIWEIFTMLTRMVDKRRAVIASDASGLDESSDPSTPSNYHNTSSTSVSLKRSNRSWSINQMFWTLVQWVFLVVTSIRLLVSTIVLSRSLPRRPTPTCVANKKSTGHSDTEKPWNPSAMLETQPAPVRVPIMEFSFWPCIANLLEVDVRMPWLSGTLSMLQWGAVNGPGCLAGYDGIIDRLFSYYIQTRILDPALLPPLLRVIRAAVFPNNAPGAPSLVAPSSDEELAALRRKCASAIWALVPKRVGRLYFGSTSFWPSPSTIANPRTNGPANASGQSRPVDSSNHSNGTPGTAHKSVAGSPFEAKGASEGGREKQLARDGQPRSDATLSETDERGRDTGEQDSLRDQINEESSLLYDVDEDRILSEIEEGILDLFSDAYCNKHLMYGMLELIIVRLMPELAQKGIIELWEERLS